MSALFSLQGHVALVTGASRGIGFAMAEALAEHGATVILNARNGKEVAEAAGRLAAKGLRAEVLAFDVTSAAATRAALDDIVARHGQLDCVVNNAGIQHRKPLAEWTDEDFERVIAVNLTACFRLAREAATRMVPRGRGRIINTGSVSAILARPTIHGYTAAKSALHGLTRSLGVELARTGVTVNAIAPGYIATELNQALLADPVFTGWVEKRTPMGRWAEPKELGGAAVFLASDASSYVTGHVLVVDGGISISL